jgi:molecular chaperone Hsp33
VAEDLAWYLTNSEQVPSSLGLGVGLDADARVAVAGGFLVQSLPPGDPHQIEILSKRIKELPPTTTLLKQGMTPTEILAQIFSGGDFHVQQQTPLQFYCPCNQQQIEDMLVGLGRKELISLREEHEPVEIVCEYCRQQYHFNYEQVGKLIEMAK